MRIFRALGGAVVAVAIVVGATGRGPAVTAQTGPQFVFVSVLERGSPVIDLIADEFVVREDGQRREVLRVAVRPSIPMQVAILVDDSRGLTSALGHIRSGLNALIDRLPDGHEIALLTFGDQLQVAVDFTRDKERLKAAATRFFLFSETSSFMLHALVETALNLRRGGATRPIIVLITAEGSNAAPTRVSEGPRIDGPASPQAFQGLGFDRVLTVLRETKVAVHTLVIRGVGNPTYSSSPSDAARFGSLLSGVGEADRAAVLQQLPTVTGGRREELGTTSALSELLTRVADEISNQYVVMYARPDGFFSPTQVEVSVTRDGMTVRSTPAEPLPQR